jgi:hypothetical protein
MPCRSFVPPRDWVEANKKRSVIKTLLKELKTGNYKFEYLQDENKTTREILDLLDKETAELCGKLQKTDVTKYSLEMQIWWRDHQEEDRKRIQKEIKKNKKAKEKKAALAKLTPYERKLLGY